MQRRRIVESSSRKNHRRKTQDGGRTSEVHTYIHLVIVTYQPAKITAHDLRLSFKQASESSVKASRNREFLSGGPRSPPRPHGQHRHQRLSVVDDEDQDEKTIS